MDSTNSASHNDEVDPVKCTSISLATTEIRENASKTRHVTKSPCQIIKRQIDSAGECHYPTNRIRSKSEQSNRQKSLYRAYSSYGFRNLNKIRSQSYRSLNENTSRDWLNDRIDKKTICDSKRYELANFHRCMKLLGVKTSSQENIGPSSHRYRAPDTKNIKPKITTRLTSSTVSLEDAQDAVLNDFEKNHIFDSHNRSFLAQAVYERWYFNKIQQRKQQRKEAELKNELLRLEFERMRCEQKLKAEKSYQEWMEKKKINKDLSPKVDLDKSKRSSERRFIPKNSEEEYIKWKTAKKEELEKKKYQKKEQKERENEEKQRKKIEAEKAYQAWKNKVTADLKKKIEQQRRLEKEKREQENRDKMEKNKEAVTSFNAWKQNKLKQMKNTRDKQKFESKLSKEARTQRIAERLYEAEQAFYEWLESVDKRISSAK